MLLSESNQEERSWRECPSSTPLIRQVKGGEKSISKSAASMDALKVGEFD